MENPVVMIGWSISVIFFLVSGIIIYKRCGHIENKN